MMPAVNSAGGFVLTDVWIAIAAGIVVVRAVVESEPQMKVWGGRVRVGGRRSAGGVQRPSRLQPQTARNSCWISNAKKNKQKSIPSAT